MDAIEIIEYLRSNEFTVKADGSFIDISPAAKVTNDLMQRLRQHKPEILKALQAESRQQKALNMLAEYPDTKRAFATDLNSDADNAILTIAIRDLATFEMLIPKDKYDPFLLLELINKGQIQ